ncbi:MAG: helix-turn-helix domain-containing protein [Methylococcales bacterium]
MPEELASEIGISRTSIERVMAGGDGLTFNQLPKLAGILTEVFYSFWSKIRSMRRKRTHHNFAPLPRSRCPLYHHRHGCNCLYRIFRDQLSHVSSKP